MAGMASSSRSDSLEHIDYATATPRREDDGGPGAPPSCSCDRGGPSLFSNGEPGAAVRDMIAYIPVKSVYE
jgi:hypothetical protein